LGKEVGQILEGQISFPLVVRYSGDNPTDLRAFEQTLLDTPSGPQVPLSAVAHVREDLGPNFITREGVQRKIVVQCNVAGRDLRGVVNDIQKSIATSVVLPQGYRVEYGGQFESEAQASRCRQSSQSVEI
jgi:Cu/Ag efflux pump CusA